MISSGFGLRAGLAAQEVKRAGADDLVRPAGEIVLQIVRGKSCGFNGGYVFEVERPGEEAGPGVEIPGQPARPLLAAAVFERQLQQFRKQKAIDLKEAAEAYLVGVSGDRVSEGTLPPVLHALLRRRDPRP